MIYFIKETVIAKILVTGATGFVGSHILENLMSIQHAELEIVAACRNPAQLVPAYRGEVRVGDLRDPDYLDRLLVGIDVVCHAAGWTSFLNDEKISKSQYLEPTLDLINHAAEWRVSRFVNLSSIAVNELKQRNNPDTNGQPRRYFPMINCLIAVEDYLKAQASNWMYRGCQLVNLRLGIYSGQRLNSGLLPLLYARRESQLIPNLTGQYAYLPLVDGKDIGQAFSRAALAPLEAAYTCLNIVGADAPHQYEVMAFLNQQSAHAPLRLSLPAGAAHWLSFLLERLTLDAGETLFTRSLNQLMSNPKISNEKAAKILGYHPEISWQASVQNFLDASNDQRPSPRLRQAVKSLHLD